MFSTKKAMQQFGINTISQLKEKIPVIQNDHMMPFLQAAELRQVYINNGGGAGKFGLPRSLMILGDSAVFQLFESGTIEISNLGKVFTEYDTVISIDYLGAECLDESSEASGSDEPYFIISYADSGGGHNTVRIGPLGDVDKGDKLFSGVGTLFTFQRRQFFLSINIMEHDSGSPEEAEQEVKDAIESLASTAAKLAGMADPSLPSGANFGEDFAGEVATFLAYPITALLGLGDDVVGNAAKRYFEPGEDFITPLNIGEFSGNTYNYVTEDIGKGSEGKYRLYFKIRVDDIPLPVPHTP